jgi:hypothetical protein
MNGQETAQRCIMARATATITAITMPTTMIFDKTLMRNTITAITITMPTIAIIREIKSKATNVLSTLY